MSTLRTTSPWSFATSSHGDTFASWSSAVVTISSPGCSVRAKECVRLKFSVVMLAPNAISSGVAPTKSAAARRPASITKSDSRLAANGPTRVAFRSTRYPAIASTTSRGTCEPPGPSRNDTSRSSAAKRARAASTSRASTVAIVTLPERALLHRGPKPRRGVEPERLDQPVADRAQRLVVDHLAGDPAPAPDVGRDLAPRHRQRDLALLPVELHGRPHREVAVGAEDAEQLALVALRQLEHGMPPALLLERLRQLERAAADRLLGGLVIHGPSMPADWIGSRHYCPGPKPRGGAGAGHRVRGAGREPLGRTRRQDRRRPGGRGRDALDVRHRAHGRR